MIVIPSIPMPHDKYPPMIMYTCRKGLWTAMVLMASWIPLQAQQTGTPDPRIAPRLLGPGWTAHWITCPGAPVRDYGVYHFRKTFTLAARPDSFIIHVSADNRYVLYVNGERVGRGPARGDLYNWNYETYDIAGHLRAGTNTVAALVWNMGIYAPVAQISYQTGFLVQGNGHSEEVVNTNGSWKAFHDSAYQPCATDMGRVLHSYMVVGPGDEVQGSRYPWGWEQPGFADSAWPAAVTVGTLTVPAGYGTDNRWTLSPRTIPPMEERRQRMEAVRRAQGAGPDAGFLRGTAPFRVAAHSTARLLIDQSFETLAYPVLTLSGGKGAVVRLTYAEALFDSSGQKGNRNEIKGKQMRGLYDIFYPDGGQGRQFSPLWVRTYRYLQLDIQTEDQPLVVNDLYGLYTGYPFEHTAAFASNDSSLQEIWNTGWRTARLCAGETYFDCPYYEQLQYEGDTRIQSLISLYNTGDDRLMRKAIHDFFNSRVPEGLTQGRFPSNRLQVIPPFSLFWVSMLYDYYLLRPDTAFLEPFLDGAATVLKWYERRVDASKGMLGPMQWWNFVDWNQAFPNGVPHGATDGHSSVISLQYAHTLQQAAVLFSGFGRREEAAHYSALAASISERTYALCFDSSRMAMADTPDKQAFSQHAGIMAILAGAVPDALRRAVMEKLLYDTTLSQATFYYRFYLTRAMLAAGMGDLYYEQLKPWRDMLAMGLTTFAENPEPTRSDCHAWSASPNYDFLATICGIMPAKPGFAAVRIEPHLGALREVRAAMPHPQGMIRIHLSRAGNTGLKAEITLPGRVNGIMVWKGQELPLKPGSQTVNF